MADQHTPGPWRAVRCPMIEGDWVIHTAHLNPSVRDVIEICNASAEDARLMAASPKMYQALVNVRGSSEWSCMESYIQESVDQAIAEAGANDPIAL